MDEIPDLAPAWLLPQIAFSFSADELVAEPGTPPDERRWSRYPSMPMILPGSDLFLRFTVLSTQSGSHPQRELRLVLLSRNGGPVFICQAWRVTGALTGLLALHMPLVADLGGAAPVPVSQDFMPARELSRPRLVEDLGLLDAVGEPTWDGLMTGVHLGLNWAAIMPLFTAMLQDNDLWRGAQYYVGSVSLFAFMGDDILDTLMERHAVPDTPQRMVDAESAVWLAFKAVEAVVGDPASNKRRLRQHLADLGLDDFPGVWRHEQPVDLVERVSDFVAARDKQAAHGRQHRQRAVLTNYEVMDYQYFASALLLHYARKVLRRAARRSEA